MGWLRQLGALFWKNYVVRKRQPVILLLEVLWPILMFIAVALMRSGSPPQSRETCSYPERALPSAGMVPFLQSSVCTLNNGCSRSEAIQEKASAQQRLRSMIADVIPLISKDTTVDAIKALPTLNVLLTAMKNVTNGTSMKEIDDKLKLRNMFMDADVMVNILTVKYKILSVQEANALLDSSLNVVELLRNTGMIDFKSIACDPERLAKYIVFKSAVDVAEVSRSICAIDDKLISNITNDLTKQLDIANLIRLGEDFASITGAMDYALLLEDIAKLVEMYMDSSSILSMFTDLPDLGDIPDAIKKLSSLIPMMTNLQKIDFDSLDAFYEIVEPTIRSLTNDSGVSEALKQLLTIGASITADPDASWSTIMQEMMPLIGQLGNSSIFDGIGPLMEQFPFNDISNFVGMLTNGTVVDDPQSVPMDASLDYMEGMLRGMIDNKTMVMIVALGSNMMDMAEVAMSFSTDMGTQIQYTLTSNPAAKEAMNTLTVVGPETATEFLVEIIKADNFYNLLSGELDMNTLCIDTAKDVLADMTVNEIELFTNTVCDKQVTDDVNSIIGPVQYEAFKTKMQSYAAEMEVILQGNATVTPDVSLKGMYSRMTDMVARTNTMAINSSSLWSNLLVGTDMQYSPEWYTVWNKIGEQYLVQSNLFLTVILMGETLENTSIWNTVGSQIQLTDAIIEAVLKLVRNVEVMTHEDKPLAKVVMYLEYLPYVMDAVIENIGNISTKLTKLDYTNTDELLKTICDDALWDSPKLSSNVPVLEMRTFICTTNWTTLFYDVLKTLNPLEMLADIEQAFNNNTNDGIDWSRMLNNVQYVVDTIRKGNETSFVSLWNRAQLDVSKVMSVLDMTMNSVMNMTTDQLSSLTNSMTDTMVSLDKALQNMTFWIEAKHYVNIWLSYAKMQNAYIEESKATGINLVDFISNMTHTLGTELVNASSVIPELLEALEDSFAKPEKLMDVTLMTDLGSLCTNGSISALLGLSPSSATAMLEEGLCGLNWTVVMQEMATSNTYAPILISEFGMLFSNTTSPWVDISLNWTDVFVTGEVYIRNVEYMFSSPPEVLLPGLDMERINASLNDIVNLITSTSAFDTARMAGLVNGMDKFLNIFLTGNDTISMALQQSIGIQAYLSYHVLVFYNKQLEYFNSTDNIDIKMYLNSEVLSKLFEMYEKGPELNAVLLHNLQIMLQDSKKISILVSNIGSMCNETSMIFSTLFVVPDNTNVTIEEVKSVVCTLNLNVDKLQEELKASLDGLTELIEAFEAVFNENMTTSKFSANYTLIFYENERNTKLLESLMNNPPNFTLPWRSPEEQINIMLKELEKFSSDINTTLSGTDVAKTMQTIQDQAYEVLMTLQKSIPGMDIFLHISKLYAGIIQRMIDEDHMFDLATGFVGYPESKKVWTLMESLPELYQTFTYTLFTDSSKISRFTESLTMGLEKLCSANPVELMTVPQGSSFNFTSFFEMFCSINMTSLQNEFNNFTDASTISELWSDLYNATTVTTTGNLTEVFSSFESLRDSITNLINRSDSTSLPRFMNASLWTETMDFVNNLLMNSSTLTQATTNTDALFAMLGSLSPDFQQQLKVVEVTYFILDNILDKLDHVTDNTFRMEDLFASNEIRKLLAIVQQPGVIETLIFSSSKPQFSERFMSGNLTAIMFEICLSNISNTLVVPDSTVLNLTALQESVCALNFTILEEEFNEDFKMSTIMDMLTSNTSVNWVYISIQNDRLTKRIEKWLTSPPEMVIPSQFMNDSYWLNVLSLYTGSMENTDVNTLLGNFESIIVQLQPVLNQDGFREFGLVMESLVEFINDNLILLEEKNVSLSKLFAKIPVLLDIYSALNISDSTYSSIVNATISDLPKFVSVFKDPKFASILCNNESFWRSTFSMDSTVNTTALSEAFCKLSNSSVYEDILKDIGFSKLLSGLSDNTSVADWAKLISTSKDVYSRMERLLKSTITLDPLDLLNNLNTTSNMTLNDLWNLLSLYSTFTDILSDELNATDVSKALNMAVETGKSIVTVFNSVLDRILSQGSMVELSSLVNTSSTLNQMLSSLSVIDSQTIHDLLASRLKQGQETGFLSMIMNSTKMIEVLCDSGEFKKMFDVPDTLNITVFIESFCIVNDSAILTELAGLFNINSVIELITGQSVVQTASIQDFAAAIQSFAEKAMRASNITGVELSAIDALLSLNFTELQSQLMKQLESLPSDSSAMTSQALNQLFSSLQLFNSSEGVEILAFLKTWTVWADIFSTRLQHMTNASVTIAALVDETELLNVLSAVFGNSSVIQDLMQFEIINPTKMIEILQSRNVSELLCSSEIEMALVIPSNSTLQDILCSGNASILLGEAIISAFAFEYVYSNELTELRNEMSNGSLIWNSAEMTESTMKLLDAIMAFANTQGSEGASNASLTTVMTDLQAMIEKQYMQIITQWAPVAMSMFGQSLPSEVTKVVATIDEVLNLVIDRLQDVTDNVTLVGLTRNSSVLISMLESIGRLNNMKDGKLLNETIDQEKLLMVLQNPDMLMQLCENSSFADYISPNGSKTSVSVDLQNVVCINPSALVQSLQNQVDYEWFEKRMNDIWNNSDTSSAPDWNTVNKKVETLTNLLMKWMETPPGVDNKIINWLDFNSTLNILSAVSLQPYMLTSIVQMLNLPSDVADVMNLLTRSMMPVLEAFKDINLDTLMNKPEELAKLMESFTSVDMWLNMVSKGYSEYLIENAGQSEIVASLVCNGTELAIISEKFGPFTQSILTLKDILCGENATEWYHKLVENKFTNADIVKIQSMFVKMSNFSLSNETSEYMVAIDTLMKIFAEMDLTSTSNQTIDSVLMKNQNTLMETGLQSMLSLMKLVDESTLDELHTILTVMVTVEKHIDQRFQDIAGKGINMTLRSLLPDSTSVAKLFEEILGGEPTAALMLAAVNPEKFLVLLFNNTWNETVCDMDMFTDTFVFPEGTNVALLQKDICDKTMEQGPAIADILKTMDVGDILKEVENLLANSTTQKANMTQLWNDISHYTEKIIGHVMNTTFDIQTWFEPIMNVLEGMSVQSTDSMIKTCDSTVRYIENTTLFQDMIKPYLNQVSIFEEITKVFLMVELDVDSVMCHSDFNNLTSLVILLKDKAVPERLQWLAEQFTGQANNVTFSCEKAIHSYTSINELMTTAVEVLTNNTNNTIQCISDIVMKSEDVLANITSLLTLGSDVMQILKDDQLQKFLTTVSGSPEILSFVDTVVNIYTEQEKAFEKVESALKRNLTELETYFQDSFDISQESLMALLNTTFGIDITNVTAKELLDTICQSGSIESALGLNTTLLNMTLCGPDRNMAETVAGSLLQLADVANKLGDLSTSDPSLIWQTLTNDLTEVLKNIDGVSQLVGLSGSLSDLDISNIGKDKELLSTLQRILVDNGPDDLLTSLNTLLDDFKLLDESNSTKKIVADVKLITDGIFGFQSLRNLFVDNIEIKDLVKNPVVFHEYMTQTLHLSKEVADAIIDGALSFEMLLDASQSNISDWVCNSTRLAEAIKFENNSHINASYVSEQFCSLDSATVEQLLDDVMMQLNVGDLLEELVVNSVSSLLGSSNITLEETQLALEQLNLATDDLKDLINQVDNYTSTIPNAVASLAQGQTGSLDMGAMSALVCGDPIPEMSDDFNVGTVVSSASSLTDKQNEEMETLPGKVCRDMYADIMKAEEGPIIWGYLKPLVRGKILFTPNTPAIAELVQKINSTFSSLDDASTIAKDWAEGSMVLGDLTGAQASEIQDMLASPLVQAMLTEVSGVATTDLESMIYTLNSTDAKLVKGLANLAQMAADYIECVELDRFIGFASEEDLLAEASRLESSNLLLAGIVFTNIPSDTGRSRRDTTSSGLPRHIQYKLRMDIDNVAHTNRIKSRMWRPIPEDDFAEDMRYLRGFMQLQDLIDNAIISMQVGSNETIHPSVTTKQFPFPCHQIDTFVNAFTAYLLPVIMTLSWITGLSVAVNNLVYDREQGQEETLRAMGLKVAINWWAWFISTMVTMSVVALICVVILHFWNIFVNSNFAIIYLYFIAFIFSSLMLCYFVSAFFTRTSLAILASLITYLISYLPFAVMLTLEVSMTFWQKTLACLSSTTAFSFACQYIARYEEQRVGIQWHNIKDSPVHNDDFSFSWICIMMVIDGCIYLVLGWYVRNVKPGKYGVSEPWYFLVCPSYWGCWSSDKSSKYSAPSQDVFAEDFATDQPVIMSVQGLSKEYSKGKRVVNNLYLDIHSGHVTTLLGHNGAAKTTTMNMMIGLLEPTEGYVKIFNRPLKGMRQSIGVCPQHNSLFEYMTVQEHMEFYNSVKSNYHGTSEKNDIKQLLKDVDLWYCRNSRVKELSGGMQRKLCVALAFVGGSKAVILDEPTSGVDPSGRRSIWNLIISRTSDKDNKDTAVLLSTHHLDEADVISDKIAIMHQGNLLCHGSPIFLKQHLASGHRLTVIKDAELGDNDPAPILAFLKQRIPDVKLQQIAGYDMTFVIPTQDTSEFYDLFLELEENKQQLKITSYGISDPTLEEVFLKTCAAADLGRAVNPDTVKHQEYNNKAMEDYEWKHDMENTGSNDDVSHMAKTTKVEGLSLTFQQFGGLLTKRFHHYRRNWRMFLSVFLLPLLLFLISSGLYSVRPNDTEAANLLLSPAMYGPSSYVIAKQESSHPLSDVIMNTFMDKPGIGTTCMPGMDLSEPYKCVEPDTDFTTPPYTADQFPNCSCDDYRYTCGDGIGVPPRERTTTTTEILQDLQGKDIEEYLLESFNAFIEKRYGGWSFHEDPSLPSELEARIWYNNKGHHAVTSFYNAYSNGLLRAMVNETKHGPASEYGITTYNHPFLFNKEQLSRESLYQNAADAGIAVTILLAFTFLPVGVMMYVVMEHINKDKYLQKVSGIGPVLYWLAAFLWDMILMIIAVAIAFGIMAIFRHDSFWERNNAPAVVCLLLLYGWATIPLLYCTTKLFKTVSAAFFTLLCTLSFLGVLTIITVLSLNYFKYTVDGFKEAYTICRYVFLIFPPYALGGGMIDMIDNQIRTGIFERFGTDVYVEPFSLDLIGWNLVAMGIEGVFFFILVIILDSRCSCSSRTDVHGVSNNPHDDIDVLNEKQRIQSGNCRDDIVVVKNLHKMYTSGGREVHAVNGVSFGVPRGQCFGLLGVNGAGKTTTFNILTGALHASSGEAFLVGKSVKQGSTVLGHNMGYCPQEEALDPFLTVEEMLHFHCKLKGLPSEGRDIAVRSVMERLQLDVIKHKVVKACSGGMKRKLSLAIALLGDPHLVLLDEPTTGMDPKAKRLVWDCILSAKQQGQAIILTSHSMEECDVLCDRMSIMVNGEFKCLGSAQHLKQMYGDGYTVALKLCGLSTTKSRLYQLMQTHFPGTIMRDQNQNVIQLDIPKNSNKVADIFDVLEREKHDLNISYYTVSQTTLETVFLNFAQEQGDGVTTSEGTETNSSTAESYSDTPLAGKPFPAKAYYGYMNRTFDNKDELESGLGKLAYNKTYEDEDRSSTRM